MSAGAVASSGLRTLTQVGSWSVGATNTPAFDSAPSAGQLLIALVVITKSVSAPSWTPPSGWNVRGSSPAVRAIVGGSNYMDLYIMDRIATGSGDTPAITTNGGNTGTQLGRFTGHAASPFVGISAGATNTGFNAQTTTDSSISATDDGVAFALAGTRQAGQTFVAWGGGFTDSSTNFARTCGTGVAVQNVLAGKSYQASLQTTGPGTGNLSVDLITAIYRAA